MHNIRIAAASVNQTPLDWSGNRERLLSAINEARAAGAQILNLPELAITGYGCEDMFFSVGVQRRALDEIAELLPHTKGMAVAVGLPLFYEASLYNAAALMVDGELAGIVCKQFMASDGIHYEPRWFRPWPAGVVGQIEWNGRLYPVGDLLFDVGGVRIGFEICRDAWIAERPGGRLARRGADVILNPSASHFAFGKQAVRERFVLEGSRAFGVTYVYCNLLGNESGRSLYDGGVLMASGGKMSARGRLFSYSDVELTVADFDVHRNRLARGLAFDSRLKVERHGDTLQLVSFAWNDAGPGLVNHTAEPEPWETGEFAKHENFSRAVPLALFDYLRKSRTQGFVVSLSGGADSSAVAVLVHLMVRRALKEMSPAEFVERLGAPLRLAAVQESLDTSDHDAVAKAFTGALLTCVYQPTRNSTETTRNSARTVAEAVGAEFLEWDIDAVNESYVQLVSQAIGRELSWDHDDLALQNIQARSRAPGAWLLANLRGALLLSTSNRSEAAVGYATMDGDTAGGLSPVAGIDKQFLLSWLRWMEMVGPDDLPPLPELSVVTSQQPTAELRPHDEGQTDEADLMPYAVLDAIERAAIRDKQLPQDVYTVIRAQFSDYDERQIGQWVVRFFELWCRNQWKRERYAPSFHVDDENLDPKSWCRFPILSSGFAEELAELKRQLKL
ncbi:NAD(+) synthase [Aeoliella sp. ICT_H6.2]|uniref:Glutamine-dependent NAD(+) synthetase n=1 Tax=Aeoliella straminimaris TaxID=2954799 RepID=A0A9X2JHE4_9BACT|nr:NAD(+) synthase [Aeoliella straminimaris]MCO6044548.1 NAD(+) synthase [Aeoliella straminimaris]